MEGSRYTILIVPSASKSLRKFQFSHRALSYALIIVSVALLSCLGILTHYIYLQRQAGQLRAIQQENTTLKATLQKSDLLTQKLNKKITTLTRLTGRLKSMAGLPHTARANKLSKLGMGGVTLGSTYDPNVLIKLEKQADSLEKSLVSLHQYFHDKNQLPSIFPADGLISSTFGTRRNPFTNLPDFHEGVDISNERGTAVVSTADGIVSFTGWRGSLGRTVEIDHEQDMTTVYGHLQSVLVYDGQKVRAGQLIGVMGNTGKSTGPHLHYEIHVKNQAVNPRRYLF